MRHALADLEGGGVATLSKFKSLKTVIKQNRRNEKGKGKIDKALNVYLICVCAHTFIM